MVQWMLFPGLCGAADRYCVTLAEVEIIAEKLRL